MIKLLNEIENHMTAMPVARVLLCQRVLESIWIRKPQNIKHHTGIHANYQSRS